MFMLPTHSVKCGALGFKVAIFLGLRSWTELTDSLRPSRSDVGKEKGALPGSAIGDVSNSRFVVLSYGKSSVEVAQLHLLIQCKVCSPIPVPE